MNSVQEEKERIEAEQEKKSATILPTGHSWKQHCGTVLIPMRSR